jgi:hypothetical protein
MMDISFIFQGNIYKIRLARIDDVFAYKTATNSEMFLYFQRPKIVFNVQFLLFCRNVICKSACTAT